VSDQSWIETLEKWWQWDSARAKQMYFGSYAILVLCWQRLYLNALERLLSLQRTETIHSREIFLKTDESDMRSFPDCIGELAQKRIPSLEQKRAANSPPPEN
jgi:hypothetical protein